MAEIPVEEIKTTNITRNEPTMQGDVQEKVVRQDVKVDTQEFTIAKFKQVVWFIIVLIEILIMVRFVFLLFGANNVNFVSSIYSLTRVFVLPFVGIFDAAAYGESFFEVASILAMIFWLVVGYVITWLLDIFSKRNVGDM